MKTILSITSLMVFLALITFSCKKESNQEVLNSNLKNTETLLQKSFQVVKTTDDLLKLHVSPGGKYTDPKVMTEDSLYHKNDSLCNAYYLTYCKDMMDGDKMMGGTMMGGNIMHGSGMMTTHTYMGDTAMMNKYNRDLISIRQSHANHHPKVTPSEHESHHP